MFLPDYYYNSRFLIWSSVFCLLLLGVGLKNLRNGGTHILGAVTGVVPSIGV